MEQIGPLPSEAEIYPKVPLVQGEFGRVDGFQIVKTVRYLDSPITVSVPAQRNRLLGETSDRPAPGRRTAIAIAAGQWPKSLPKLEA